MKNGVPFIVMIIVESGEVGMITLGKAAMDNGMSNLVYVVYYNSLGTLLLFPFFIFRFFRSVFFITNLIVHLRFSTM